ncbi:methyltransferase domain-containing protein, partial [Streptomyces katrae]
MSEDHTRVQEFFGARADAWDEKFPEDGPAFTAAVAECGIGPGERVLDAGCGTGRALTPLREAVGPSGTVLGVDLTERMLAAARRAGRGADGTL